MSDFGGDSGFGYRTSTQPEGSSYSNEDFEKLDHPGDLLDPFSQQPAEAEQDQHDDLPTSTFTGEEAEEDRYGTSEATPNLLNFGDEAVEEPQSTTPSAPEVGEFYPSGYQPEPVPQTYSQTHESLFNAPVSSTTASGYDGAGDHEREHSEPLSEPFTNLSSTESKEWTGKTTEQTVTGGAWLKNIDPRVLDLIYWRDVKKTGIVFGSMMFMLLSLAFFSVLSVAAYLSLAALTITLSFRVYKNVLQAVQKTGDQHPFKQYLDLNIDLPEDKVQKAVANVTKHINNASREVRRLFLVEDLVDSIKFGLLLWVLTYIGAWFNGMTIIILDVVTIFTIPKFYETYKTQIDSYLDVARTNINKVITQVKAKIPFPSKKAIKKE